MNGQVDKQAIIAELKRRASSGHPDAQMINEHMQTPEFQALGQQQTQQPGVTQDPRINALIQQAMQPKGVRQNLGDALSVLGGGKPNTDQLDLSKIYAEQTIKNLPQFKDKNYVVSYGQDGKPIFTEAPGDIKSAPFYATQLGGDYYEAKKRQAAATAENFELGSDLVKDAIGEDGGEKRKNLPVGTTVTSGGVTVPMNPKLEENQSSAIASNQVFRPQAENIAESVRGGIFGPENSGVMNNVKRTFKQAAVDTGIPLLTSLDPKLQAVQSDLNSIRRYAFGEGGKALTGTEKGIVFKLLDVTGKSDERIIQDHQKALQTLQAKSDLALGGMNEARNMSQSSNDFSQMTDDELRRIASGGA